jgi:integrase
VAAEGAKRQASAPGVYAVRCGIDLEARGKTLSELSGKYVTRARADAIWSYRFNVDGKTYKDGTGTFDKAKAETFAANKRAEVIALIAGEKKLGRGPMSFGRACEIYIAEKVPTFRSMSEDDARTQIDFFQKYVKPGLLIHEIPASDIQKMSQARAECLRKGRGGVWVRVKASTVNQSVELFKRILTHAHDAHGATIRHYKWSAFKAKVQKVRRGDKAKRAIQTPTEQVLLSTIHPNYLQVSRFALLSGLRANENLLRWDQVDWDAKMARDVRGKNRQEVGRDVRLGAAAMAVLQAEYNRHDRHAVFVFGYLCTKSKRMHVGRAGAVERRIIKGCRYPITYSGWNAAWDRCKEKLGLHGKVRIHDWRHTFATRMAKKVSVVDLQTMMDHSKVETTLGYVTVDDEAIRAALDSAAMPMPLEAEQGNIAPLVAPPIVKTA